MKALAPVKYWKPSYENIRAQCKDEHSYKSAPDRGMDNKGKQARAPATNSITWNHTGTHKFRNNSSTRGYDFKIV